MIMNKEMYLSNPRSKALRAIGLQLLSCFETLLYGENTLQQDMYAHIEHLNGKLIEMGIVPGMNTGLDKDAYSNPVTAAEYLAGQLMEETGRYIVPEHEIIPIVEEWSVDKIEVEGQQAHFLSSDTMPKRVRSFVVSQQFISTVARFFDREEDEANV